MLTVTGSPIGAFVDALLGVLVGDATLMAIASGGIYTSLPLRQRTPFPFVVLNRHQLGPSDAPMQLEGGRCSVMMDVWSAPNSPDQTRRIQARIRVLLQRRDVAVAGFALIQGSLSCDEELVMQEPDPDIPERQLFHGVQRWSALLEDAL